jgi:DNA-binding response OmpR family regulator
MQDVQSLHSATPPPCVLVDDDERCVRDLLRLALEQGGFAVLTVPDGPAAVRLAAGSEPFDEALVDRGLPGMGGEETVVALRRLRPGVPVLLASGEPPEGGLPEGCAGLLLKPFALGNLVSRLRALLPRR